MRERIEEAARAFAKSDRPLLSIAVAAPLVATSKLLVDRAPSLVLFDPSDEAGAIGWSFVGWGEVARVEAEGASRFAAIRARGADLLASVHDVESERGGPSLRLFGGFAFDDLVDRTAPWSAFAAASFTLPRVLYARAADRAILRVTIERGDVDRAEAIVADALEAIVRAGARAELASSSPPEARFDHASAEAWSAKIDDALRRIQSREMEKVVASTQLHVAATAPLDLGAAAASLASSYPDCVAFAFTRGVSTFLGASPERLIARRGLRASTDALAGSAPRRRGAEMEAALDLLSSSKDRREHEHVVVAITAALAPFVASIEADSEPRVRTLKNVHHLHTPIRAELARDVHVLELAAALHPTPAVCGAPREPARAWIRRHEPHRGWYSGAVGWFDAAGDGAFSVGIRAGVVALDEAWIFAGAGIVEGSDAAREWNEVQIKQTPLLAALKLA